MRTGFGMIHNLNTDGFDSVSEIQGRLPRPSLPPERREIKKIAKSKLLLNTTCPFDVEPDVKLADFLSQEGVVDDISHEACASVFARKASHFNV